MTLAPFVAAPTVVQLHVLAAVAAFALGVVQLVAPKNAAPHRVFGWLWVALLATVALAGQTACPESPGAPPSEYQVKAAFLYNFAKFVEWPFGRPGRERRRQPGILRLR